jgi:hypothetical protein
MRDADLLRDIEARVRPTICPTFGVVDGAMRESLEGRISQTDFDTLLDLIARVREAERERCAGLHEQVDPASDDERLRHVPGAGAMAVIQYRDLIRSV